MRSNAKVEPSNKFVIESILEPEGTDRGVHADAGAIAVPIAWLAASSGGVAQDSLAAVQVCSIVKEECALHKESTHLTWCRSTIAEPLVVQYKMVLNIAAATQLVH